MHIEGKTSFPQYSQWCHPLHDGFPSFHKTTLATCCSLQFLSMTRPIFCNAKTRSISACGGTKITCPYESNSLSYFSNYLLWSIVVAILLIPSKIIKLDFRHLTMLWYFQYMPCTILIPYDDFIKIKIPCAPFVHSF